MKPAIKGERNVTPLMRGGERNIFLLLLFGGERFAAFHPLSSPLSALRKEKGRKRRFLSFRGDGKEGACGTEVCRETPRFLKRKEKKKRL